MSVASLYSQLEALCHAAQRRPPSRVEVDRQRVSLLSEIDKLAKEIEQSRETIIMLRRRNREHIKAEKELVRVLQLERRERALEHRQLTSQLEHLQANCYREQERVASLTSENEQWRSQAHKQSLTIKRYDSSDTILSNRSTGRPARPLLLRSRSNSNASLSSIRPKPYLLSEIEEACSDTSSSILADVPRHSIHLSELDLERSIERQSHLDLNEYFWNRCPHKFSCDMACQNEHTHDAYLSRRSSVSSTNRERRLCRIPSIEFNELFTSTEESHAVMSPPIQRNSSVRRRESLARLVQDVMEMQNSCHTALGEVNEQIRRNRSRIRDIRHDVVKLQTIITDTESRLEVAQQHMVLHADTTRMNTDMERIKEYQSKITNTIASKKAMTEQLQSLRSEEKLLREQKQQIEQHLGRFQEEMKAFQAERP